MLIYVQWRTGTSVLKPYHLIWRHLMSELRWACMKSRIIYHLILNHVRYMAEKNENDVRINHFFLKIFVFFFSTFLSNKRIWYHSTSVKIKNLISDVIRWDLFHHSSANMNSYLLSWYRYNLLTVFKIHIVK